jgi:sRNA-binding carbon storage regulator CsrA
MIEDSDDKKLAVKTLRSICENVLSPAQAKATAARTLLELSGDIGRLQTSAPRETRMLHELTREELDAEIKRAAPDAVQASKNTLKDSSKRVATRRVAKRKYDF